MRRGFFFVSLLLWVAAFIAGCRDASPPIETGVTFDQLFSNPESYHGKSVIVEAFYFNGFEVIVLSEVLEASGYAEGHLVPKGRLIWVEGAIPEGIYDQLYEQHMMGPSERYGKLRVHGQFEYGGEYGHVGGYQYQIVPSQVELLPWTPK